MSYQSTLPDWNPEEGIEHQDLDPTNPPNNDILNMDISNSGQIDSDAIDSEAPVVQSVIQIPALELLAQSYYYPGISLKNWCKVYYSLLK